MFYDYSESGSWTESTFVRNESVFNEILLRQRVAVDLTNRSQNKEILGEYICGNEGQDYQHNYVRKVDEQDVFRTNDNIYYLLNTSVTYWGKNPPKPKTDPDTTKAS